jgi:hypothetical protein
MVYINFIDRNDDILQETQTGPSENRPRRRVLSSSSSASNLSIADKIVSFPGVLGFLRIFLSRLVG